ncbi:SDR family NAD(P)-dependent oxidoreductase [Thalassomonas sp. M1454]|uniref:SDR family NAD(P)-dependent oxidoreductase n=1 Tax=Thalassomonas sp. M1454 TaxID=2594477 RepID=UPI0011816934|nr:SDR family NAD(P)-dependent oxidoreductase [Thalassomonas sp. M1454]TRX52836.1 SDR family NAD(P)-dependent oxidoreductase [Thalassomonas sp. M1454]
MKNIFITGATDGIGLETAKLLAEKGHNLIIHGRSAEKLKSAEQQLRSINPTIKINTYLADLANFTQVRKLIEAITNANKTIDVIINNAGVFKISNAMTASGIDVRFVVNTITPLIITQELLPLLAADGRIVNLSSAAQAPIDINALSGKVSIEDEFQAYAQSKLAITIWSQELAKLLTPKQVIVAVNPGSLLASKMVKEGFGVAGNDLSIGADILIRAALENEFASNSGKYFDNDIGKFSSAHQEAEDTQKCQRLMTALEQIVKQHS